MNHFQPSAKIVADSITRERDRLTTFEVTFHRFVLSEFNTHRAFSRNSASSRAIPYARMREKALETPAIPLSWPREQKGMQGGEELPQDAQIVFEQKWLVARDAAIDVADDLHRRGVHKSVVNRLLEPFIPHTVIVSATDWKGFWEQRVHPDAQPEIRILAEKMQEVYEESIPEELGWGEFHLPYVSEEELEEYPVRHKSTPNNRPFRQWQLVKENPVLKLAVARCARVSYLTHDGKRDVSKDFELFDRLAYHKPAHASPFEHVAAAGVPPFGPVRGNFRGWNQLRHILEMV